MAKSDPEAQRKSSLSDCTWLEIENGSFKVEALNALLENRGVHFTHTHIILFLFLIFLILFFLSFFLSLIIYIFFFL
jgi:type IV secretory pathway TrbL component